MDIPRPCVSIPRSTKGKRPGHVPNPQRDDEKPTAHSFYGRVRRMKHTVSLKQNHEFRRLYNKGKSAASPYMAVYCRKNRGDVSRLGLTTGVKLGHAVQRNRVRRRLREIYRTNEHRLASGWDIVIVARVKSVYTRYSDLERSFLALARKLELLAPTGEQS